MRKILYGKKSNHVEMAHVLNNIGASYANMGDKERAINYAEKAYEMQKRIFADKDTADHADVVETLENLSAAYSSKSSLDNEKKSLEFVRKAYEMQTRLFPNIDHPRTARLLLSIAKNYSNLATLIKNKSKEYAPSKEWQSEHEEKLAIAHDYPITDSPHEEYETMAIEKKQEALDMQTMLNNGRNSLDMADTLQSLGISFERKSDFKMALDYYKRAYEMRKSLLKNKPHVNLIETLERLEVVSLRLRNKNEAIQFGEMAIEMKKQMEKIKV